MMTGGEKEKDRTWVRACRWYVGILFVFAFVVPILPKSVQEATYPGANPVVRPLGLVMMLLFAFSLPIAAPNCETDSLRSRVWFGVFMVLMFGGLMASAAYSVAHPSAPPAASALSARSCP